MHITFYCHGLIFGFPVTLYCGTLHIKEDVAGTTAKILAAKTLAFMRTDTSKRRIHIGLHEPQLTL